jgi:hypothetical protein
VRNFAWPAGASTGIGSLPGTDVREAARIVLGEGTELPFLPELPARGLGADLIGRTASLLVDIAVDWQPHGWTVTARRGRDLGQARDFLLRDLDELTERGQGVPRLKVQVCGPITLATAIELPNLYKLLSDQGALRDLTASLAEGVSRHLADLARRLPGTELILQLDEPSLPAVLAGHVPTPSGYGTLRALDRPLVEPLLAQVLAAVPAGSAVVHCCAAGVPFELLRAAGAAGVSYDDTLIGRAELDAVGEFIESGGSLWIGVVPGTDTAERLQAPVVRRRITELWNRLGFAEDLLADTVVPTPRCGLGGASMPYVRSVFEVLAEVGRSLSEGTH